jgi:type I restriction enzyme, S subunit
MKKESLSKNICVSAGETKNEEAGHALVPKLRFPEFRVEPKWHQQELRNIAVILKGKGISKADIDPNGSQECIRYGELYTRYGETIKEAASRTKVSSSELFLSKPDDVIIPSSGETKIDIAKASCVLAGGIALGGDLNVIRSKINGTFLSYYLNGPKRQDIAKVAQGDTVVHLYPHQLEALLIAVPSPAEQQKIAECLSSLDELIAARTRKVDALKTHKKGLMQQLFPREGETQPRLRFPEFQNAGEWEAKTLVDACRMQAGKFVAAADIKEQNAGDLFPCYGGNGLRGFTATHTHDGVFPLIGRQGALCGNIKLATGRFHATEHAVVATPNRGVEVVWLYYLLDLLNLNRFATGQAQPGLSVDVLEKVAVTIPNDEREQQRIATCLSSLDALIATETKKLEALRTHKKGLMQQLFPSPENIEA